MRVLVHIETVVEITIFELGLGAAAIEEGDMS